MSVELPPLPDMPLKSAFPAYGAKFNWMDMQDFARAAVDAALERAAVVCDAHDKDRAATGQHADAEHCAAAIRAMKSPISDNAV